MLYRYSIDDCKSKGNLMSFHTYIEWTRLIKEGGEFCRDHTITFGSGQKVEMSPKFKTMI